MSNKQTYEVLPGVTVKFRKKYHGPGSKLNLDEKEHAKIVDCVKPVSAESATSNPSDPEFKLQGIAGAIRKMQQEDPKKENKEFWTKAGDAEIKELERRTGWQVSAAERKDAAELLPKE